ncbi:MAG: hypothetical protein MUD12_12630 [Spirochaetes bacterium]|jgi:hypothetical protein|nr:hypothetical protein [Spirochaetota bacterium]
MQLTFINGSPRGEKGNTAKLMDNFVKGFLETPGNKCAVEYIVKHRKNPSVLKEIFYGSENVIIGFPLYADAMPGSVKEFLDAIIPAPAGAKIPSLGFMSQCGFPETGHLRYVERYLEKFTKRLGADYLGSIMKGGGEGLHMQPKFLVEKFFNGLHFLGKKFGETGKLDRDDLDRFARPEHLTPEQINGIIPFINKALWDEWMKENGALEKSFDRPYKK